MRLSVTETGIIKNVILKYTKDTIILLFGSRVYDNKKGGDIDLLVQTSSNITLKDKIKILTELEINGIDRKVDLLFKTPHTKEESIFKTALREGVIL